MKQLIITVMASLLAMAVVTKSSAQYFDNSAVIRPYDLAITWNKTTTLIFPAAIQSADRGEGYILAKRVPGVDNVLKVKAGQKGFDQSNLSVITKDGKVFTFLVNYMDNPPYQVIDLNKMNQKAPVAFSGLPLNYEQMGTYATLVAAQKPFLHKHDRSHQMDLQLQGIYIESGILFFRFALENHSHIEYEPDLLRFYIRDKKTPRRTAVQEQQIQPLLIQTAPVKKDTKSITVAFKKFTIADKKLLSCEVMEKGGDRNLRINVAERKLLRAKDVKSNQ